MRNVDWPLERQRDLPEHRPQEPASTVVSPVVRRGTAVFHVLEELPVRDLVFRDRESGHVHPGFAEFVVPTESGLPPSAELRISRRDVDPLPGTPDGRSVYGLRLRLWRNSHAYGIEVVQQAAESLCVHQPMLEADLGDIPRHVVEDLIDGFLNPTAILLRLSQTRPVGGLVRWQVGRVRVDTESEQFIEFGIEWIQSETVAADHVPIEGLKVANIEIEAVTLRNGPFEQRVGLNEIE